MKRWCCEGHQAADWLASVYLRLEQKNLNQPWYAKIYYRLTDTLFNFWNDDTL